MSRKKLRSSIGWQSLYERRVRRQYSQVKDNGDVVHVEASPGIVIVVPACMFDAVACIGHGTRRTESVGTGVAELHLQPSELDLSIEASPVFKPTGERSHDPVPPHDAQAVDGGSSAVTSASAAATASMSPSPPAVEELRSIERTSAVAHWRTLLLRSGRPGRRGRPRWRTPESRCRPPFCSARRSLTCANPLRRSFNVQTNLESQRRQYDLGRKRDAGGSAQIEVIDDDPACQWRWRAPVSIGWLDGCAPAKSARFFASMHHGWRATDATGTTCWSCVVWSRPG